MFAEKGSEIACIIVEPVAGNMNCIPPVPGFLQGLRNICDEYGTVLIFDEVMTGFRVALGGAQAHYDVQPDLTTLGKIIGGGLPVGAFGGRRNIMKHLAPLGSVYQAGTLSGNPLAMAAGLATLRNITQNGFHDELTAKVSTLLEGVRYQAELTGFSLRTSQAGAMFGLFFTEQESVERFDQSMACDSKLYGRFFHAMLNEGVYLAPSAFEAGFISAAHSNQEIEQTIEAAGRVFQSLINDL